MFVSVQYLTFTTWEDLGNMLLLTFMINFPPSFFCTYAAIPTQYIKLICTYTYHIA